MVCASGGARGRRAPRAVMTAGNVYASFSCVLRRAPHGQAVYGSLHPTSAAVDHPAAEPGNGEDADMLRALSDNLPVIVWSCDAAGVITRHDGRGPGGARPQAGAARRDEPLRRLCQRS